MTRFVYDDGGRAAAGFPSLLLTRRGPGDCVARSVAIATGKPYAEVHRELGQFAERVGGVGLGVEGGLVHGVGARYLQTLGWGWMINHPARVCEPACACWPPRSSAHHTVSDLPAGRYVLEFRSRKQAHMSALVDGENRDLEDHSDEPLYGWFSPSAPVVELV